MAFEIILAPAAATALKNLSVPIRTGVTKALAVHLTHEPTKVSKSRIKRLRALANRITVCALATSGCSMTLQRRKSKSSRSSRRPKRSRGSTNKARPRKVAKEVALAEVKDDLVRSICDSRPTRRSSSRGTVGLRVSSSDLLRTMNGSSIVSNITPSFCVVSRRPERLFARAKGSRFETSGDRGLTRVALDGPLFETVSGRW